MLFCDGSLAPQPYAGAYSTRPSAETPRCPCPEAEAEVAGGRIQISCLFLGRGYLQATGVAAVFPRCPQNFSPEWSSPMGTALSVVIPAYNEARRLPPYLASVRRYLDKRYPDGYEVIVVDDGSGDGLSDVLAPLSADWPELVVMRHPENRGKGAAVRTGILAARGDLFLFADADGATPIDEEANLHEAVRAGAKWPWAPGWSLRRTSIAAGPGPGHCWAGSLQPSPAGGCTFPSTIPSAASRCSAARPVGNCSFRVESRAISSTWSFWCWPSGSDTGSWKCPSIGPTSPAAT